MQLFYLTPASIGYLTQFILSLAITAYLLRGNRRPSLLAGVFIVTTLFVGLLFLDAAVLPGPRLVFVYLENTALGVLLFLLLRFAYHFPAAFAQRRWEARLVLGLSLAYTLYEAAFAVYRFYLLFGRGMVEYRLPEADYALTALLAWVPVAFLSQSLAASESPGNWLRPLWLPQGQGARGARIFMLTFLLLLALSVIGVMEIHSSVSSSIYSASVSLGILAAMWMFATTYLNVLPENTSFLVKLSGMTLILLLAILGMAGWAVSPGYLAVFHPTLADHQTLRFTPNTLGGYDIAEIPFAYETELGERLAVTSYGESRNQRVDFSFPFYGKTYSELYITSVGLISLGQKLYHPNLQSDYTAFPGIFPLLVDLEPERGGGVYANATPESLIITWDHLPALDAPESVYTFQAVLYVDGRFDFSYNGLPEPLEFAPDARPSAAPWLRGVTPGVAGQVTQVDDLSQPSQGLEGGIVQDFYLDFRRDLHAFIAPLAWLIVGGGLFIILGLPVLVNANLIRPLNALLEGIGRVEGGDLSVEMPIQHRDEIGSLTASFNKMAAQLRKNVTELEQRVAERTAALQMSNAQLKAEVRERENAEMQLIQQQRDLAASEQREQMSRELHDGIGQVLGYINLQAQAAQMLVEKNQLDEAQENLTALARAAREAHTDLRQYILGLRAPVTPQRDFYQALQAYLSAFHQSWGIETVFNLPQIELPALPPAVEDQLLHIVQEALVNIRKHARARKVEVSFTLEATEMTLTICDDGQGFEPQLAPGADEAHFGLSIMRERAEQVGAKLEVRSAVGSSTQVVVSLKI
jgi:signal transduction histidine kinase